MSIVMSQHGIEFHDFTLQTTAFESNPNSGRVIFGFGIDSGYITVTNLVSNTGVMGNDTASLATARENAAAAGYGGDRAIFFNGYSAGNGSLFKAVNYVSNIGVMSTDSVTISDVRQFMTGSEYGGDKAIFFNGYSLTYSENLISFNYVSNTGVVADTSQITGFHKRYQSGARYGDGNAIFSYGYDNFANMNVACYISNNGAIAADVSVIGNPRWSHSSSSYGGDKAIIAFGNGQVGGNTSITNLVSNTGVISNNVINVNSRSRYESSGGCYGGDKAIFGYGWFSDSGQELLKTISLVSNTGVMASDTISVGVARRRAASAGF